MERRDFVGSALAGSALGGRAKAGGSIPRRTYRGKIQLSMIGFGGIVVMGHEQNEADRIVAEAVDRTVNYFDVAPTYGDGEAEIKLGPALQPHRKGVFLACKTTERSAEGARKELERSLTRLRTDHFDLYQFHGLASMADVDRILAPGGAAELFRKARQEGKALHLGASAHSPEAAVALMDQFPLDSVLFPVNFVCWEQGKFGSRILEHAKKKGMARLALKAMAYTKWPKGASREKYPYCWYQPADTPELARKAVRFTLSQEITAAIPPGNLGLFRMALDIASNFQPLDDSEMREVLASTAGVEPIFRA